MDIHRIGGIFRHDAGIGTLLAAVQVGAVQNNGQIVVICLAGDQIVKFQRGIEGEGQGDCSKAAAVTCVAGDKHALLQIVAIGIGRVVFHTCRRGNAREEALKGVFRRHRRDAAEHKNQRKESCQPSFHTVFLPFKKIKITAVANMLRHGRFSVPNAPRVASVRNSLL